jgi:hypothetical protein
LLQVLEPRVQQHPFYDTLDRNGDFEDCGRLSAALFLAMKFITDDGMKNMDAIEKAARFWNVGASTMCQHLRKLSDSREVFILSFRGKHAKAPWWMEDSRFKMDAQEFCRSRIDKHSSTERLSPRVLQRWLNQQFKERHLADGGLEATAPQVGERAAHRYLTSWLGFSYCKYTKDYVDGHERPDVVAARNEYLAQKELTDTRTVHVWPAPDELRRLSSLSEKPIVEFCLDECTLNANDKPRSRWVEEGQFHGKLRSKSLGAGIHLCVVINELQGGVLACDGEVAAETLVYGQGVWWNSERFLVFMTNAIRIRHKLLPWAHVIWRLDHSSNHKAKGVDALNAKRMNVSSGGCQPVMHSTTFTRQMADGKTVNVEQSMVLEDGVTPKGLRLVLEERYGEEAVDNWKGKKALQEKLARLLGGANTFREALREACPQ